ncbi:hypothetical protein SEVIR_6G026401v4 [Setaria viridis]
MTTFRLQLLLKTKLFWFLLPSGSTIIFVPLIHAVPSNQRDDEHSASSLQLIMSYQAEAGYPPPGQQAYGAPPPPAYVAPPPAYPPTQDAGAYGQQQQQQQHETTSRGGDGFWKGW